MSSALKIEKPVSITVQTGAPAPLFANQNRAFSVIIKARGTNTDKVVIGDDSITTADPGLEPGEAMSIGTERGTVIDLSQVFALSASPNQIIDVWYTA